jgi:carboxyl-terminal processing protease
VVKQTAEGDYQRAILAIDNLLNDSRGRMNSTRRTAVLSVFILGICAVLGGLYGPSVTATAAGASELQTSVKSFTQVLALVQQNYAEPVDTEKAVYEGAIPSMLRVLDPHSNFFDPKQYALLKEEQHGKYYGVGMSVAPKENHTVVVSPFFGSPAFNAGIRPGDIISKVDGKSCDGLTTTEVADLLKGPKGTPVEISLVREGWDEPIVVHVTRDEIPRPGVDFHMMIKPGIGYVRVSTFNETTDSELGEALDKLDYPHLDGLILDLRGNTGGLLPQAVGIGDMFLDKNELIVSHRGRSSPERSYYALHGNDGVTVPLVLLINGQSASASEIVAGAMQDHDRAIVVGETSFGKGLVQTQFPLSEDSALLLTTAKYYTPSGRLVQRDYKGVSLYDYHYNPQPPKQPEVKLTDSGRQVYGGGGITPDVVVPDPKLNPFQELLLRRGVFFVYENGVGDFTRYFLGQKPEITKEWNPDAATINTFRKFLDSEHIQFTEPEISENLTWIEWKIKREVFTSLFGLNDGYKVQLSEDPQLDKAIAEIPEAKALYEKARTVLAQKQAAEVSHP